MASLQSTTINSPIELKSTERTCDKTCSYKFDYGLSDCTVQNMGNYLKLGYSSPSSTITYNESQCNVQEVRLYKPSLNMYYNSKADAELIINHVVSGGNNLLVCIPIVASDAKSKSSTMLAPIIQLAPINENEGIQTVNVKDYTLNNVIPLGPFYAYSGTLPYDDLNGTYNVIIFDSNAVTTNISTKSMETLGTIIQATKSTPNESYDTDHLFYNKTGTSLAPTSDDIYIDCNLVDESGELVNADGSSMSSPHISFGDQLKELFDNPYFDTILFGSITLIAFYFIKKRLIDN